MPEAESPLIMKTIDRAEHTVLVVDDNAATRYSTARVIRAAGFRTLEAATGAEAVAASARGVSAVVLDVHLPDMDGFEACRAIRLRPSTEFLPVVHLSAAYVRNEHHVAGLNAGADSYLVHPVEPAVLVATLQALIRARTAEDRLRRSEQRLRSIFDQAQSAIALLDAEGCLSDVNPALLRLLDSEPQALRGRPLHELVPEGWGDFVRQEVMAHPAEHWRGEFPLVGSAGREVHLEWSISPHGDPGLRIAVGIDISQRHELEQRRKEVLEREQAARAQAEHHSRTKDNFIAVLSHELRTPLNAINGWVHILKRRGITPEGLRGLEAIERNVQAQTRIISDILDVSRINSGKLQLERQWIDPAELVRSSILALEFSAAEKQLRIETDLAGAPSQAWLDPGRFQQVFWNLMTNAVKFSESGGVVQVSLERRGSRMRLEVRDQGQGIEPAFLPHLFDPFSQSDAPGNRRHGGLGLGLSIVKHLVDLHEGEVCAISDGPGRGTTLRVELPVQAGDACAAEPADGERAGDEDLDMAGQALLAFDVLVVEDDREASEMMKLVLGERGATVRTAVDVDAALAALAEHWPDVMVSDIGLPGRDGYELVRELRQMEAARPAAPLPAIALTAFARPVDVCGVLEAGFDLHLAKPIRPHRLIGAIATLMAQRQRPDR